MDETYYWLSARDRMSVLLKAFRLSGVWVLISLATAFLLNLLLGEYFRDNPFFHITFLVSSFLLFFIAVQKPRIEARGIMLYRGLYAAATGIIIFWITVKWGILAIFCVYAAAAILFLFSAYAGLRYRSKLNGIRRPAFSAILLAAACIVEFFCNIYGIYGCYVISLALCIIFAMHNMKEIQKYDDFLRPARQKAQIEAPLPDWGFEMFINLTGMIFYPDAVRLVAKITATKRQTPKTVP